MRAEWILVIGFDINYITVLFIAKAKAVGIFLFLSDVKRLYMTALRGDKMTFK